MKLNNLYKQFIKEIRNKNSNKGFTFLEFIFVITLLGITSSFVIPVFKNGINKSKQKEASLIVSSMIKGAQSNYGVEADLPRTIGDISKFANFLKCDADQVEIEGQVICRNRKPVKVDKNDDHQNNSVSKC